MELTKCIQVLEQCVGYPIQAHEDQGVYQWIHAKQQFHFFQKNNNMLSFSDQLLTIFKYNMNIRQKL